MCVVSYLFYQICKNKQLYIVSYYFTYVNINTCTLNIDKMFQTKQASKQAHEIMEQAHVLWPITFQGSGPSGPILFSCEKNLTLIKVIILERVYELQKHSAILLTYIK